MTTNDPTQFPGNTIQWSNMGTTDMSWLLGGGQSSVSPDQSLPQDQQNPADNWSQNSEMYKKTIEALMSKVQSKYGELNAAKFSGDNQNAAKRNDILKTIFETMKQAGVDPSDPQAINEFMAELEQNSPDLFQLFTEALNALLWPDATQQMNPVDTSLPPTDPNQWQPQSPVDPTQSPVDPTQSPVDSNNLSPQSQFPNLVA